MFVSSFDKTVAIYNNTEIKSRIVHFSPVSKLSVLDDKIVFCDIEGGVKISENYIKTDCGGIQGLASYQNAIITGGWNKKIQILQSGTIVHTIPIKHKVYAMDLNNNTLLVGCDSSTYFFMDLRKPERVVLKDLKGPVCSVSLGHCAAIGTTRGEIKIDFDFFTKESNMEYTFNAHKENRLNQRINHPITSLIVGDTLISGGSDGRIYEFDYNQRRKLREIIHNDIPVSSLRESGNFIVAGFSDNFEKGKLSRSDNEIRILKKQ